MTYNEFIQDILNTRGRFNIDGYKERHHIIPECLGGETNKENLIDLTAQEHYEAHKLLAEENPDIWGLQTAWWNFCIRKASPDAPEIFITADEYAKARENHAKATSERFKGKDLFWLHTPEVVRKMSESRKGKNKGKDNAASCPVICIETGMVFMTVKDAVKFYNISSNNILRVCKDGNRCGGYHWKTVHDYINETILYKLNMHTYFDKDWFKSQI